MLEFSEFARFYNALIAFVARLKEKRGSGGGAAGREAEEAAKKAAEEYEAEVKARREADESKKEAAAAEDAAGLPDGGCWPVWYNDELRDAGTVGCAGHWSVALCADLAAVDGMRRSRRCLSRCGRNCTRTRKDA